MTPVELEACNKEMEKQHDENQEPPTTPTLRQLLTEFVALEHRRRDCDGELETVKAKIAEIEPLLREEMAICGLQNARCDGLTIFVKTDRYVSKKGEFSTEQICEVLRVHGLDYMIGEAYSAASLKAKVLEWLAEGQEVPAKLAEMLNVGEAVRLSTRK